MLALLTIIAMTFSTTSRTETVLTANHVQSAQAQAAAEAGIWIAVYDLLKPEQAQYWKHDNAIKTVQFNDAQIAIQIQDETGKIDLNSARTEILNGLITSLPYPFKPGEEVRLLQSILDWRDRDNLVRQYGAEDGEYAAQGLPYGTKNGPFNSVDELRLVLGMNNTLYQLMQPALTVYSHQPGISPDVAPANVLLAVPGSVPDDVHTYVNSRNEIQGTAAGLSTIDPRYFSKVHGNTFTITSTAQSENSHFRYQAVIAIDRSLNQPYSVLSWTENNLSAQQESKG